MNQPGIDDGFLGMEKEQPRSEASKIKAGNFSGGLFIDYKCRNKKHCPYNNIPADSLITLAAAFMGNAIAYSQPVTEWDFIFILNPGYSIRYLQNTDVLF